MAEHDDIWADADDLWGTSYGVAVTVIPPTGAERACTGIVTGTATRMTNDPRNQSAPATVSLPNDATTGIAFTEWNNRFKVRLALAGQSAQEMRTTRLLQGSTESDRCTWELL